MSSLYYEFQHPTTLIYLTHPLTQICKMFREMAKVRGSMRQQDISESKHLLWELVTHEPTMLQCFSIVEATCLAQGLFCKIDGERCGEKFQRFLDRHYIPFCRQVKSVRTFLLLFLFRAR